ncbi:chromosomal replication initiator protein DnaA [Striga asiatica]|uniref:Chromosomal replication initiator protein DnaA n=1 Tax=Striga asiatica TaxID=4170 RepID=A0A5A7PZ66_STRAF|nr:chromosomal replication initiator protein DnaA [Striga asiatica]
MWSRDVLGFCKMGEELNLQGRRLEDSNDQSQRTSLFITSRKWSRDLPSRNRVNRLLDLSLPSMLCQERRQRAGKSGHSTGSGPSEGQRPRKVTQGKDLGRLQMIKNKTSNPVIDDGSEYSIVFHFHRSESRVGNGKAGLRCELDARWELMLLVQIKELVLGMNLGSSTSLARGKAGNRKNGKGCLPASKEVKRSGITQLSALRRYRGSETGNGKAKDFRPARNALLARYQGSRNSSPYFRLLSRMKGSVSEIGLFASWNGLGSGFLLWFGNERWKSWGSRSYPSAQEFGNRSNEFTYLVQRLVGIGISGPGIKMRARKPGLRERRSEIDPRSETRQAAKRKEKIRYLGSVTG